MKYYVVANSLGTMRDTPIDHFRGDDELNANEYNPWNPRRNVSVKGYSGGVLTLMTPVRDKVPVIAPVQKPRQTNEQLAAELARLKAALAGKMAVHNS